jgi:hypothetical protein
MFRIVVSTSISALAGQADVILLGGKIITTDPTRPTAEAIGLGGIESVASVPMMKSGALRDHARESLNFVDERSFRGSWRRTSIFSSGPRLWMSHR